MHLYIWRAGSDISYTGFGQVSSRRRQGPNIISESQICFVRSICRRILLRFARFHKTTSTLTADICIVLVLLLKSSWLNDSGSPASYVHPDQGHTLLFFCCHCHCGMSVMPQSRMMFFLTVLRCTCKTSRVRRIYAMILFYILAADHLLINCIITFLGFALLLPSPFCSTPFDNVLRVLTGDNRVHH